jgi:amino-acid N-acetyltransferase
MSVTIRRATPGDAEAIHALISTHVGEYRLLPRSLPSTRKTIEGWVVARNGDRLVGCGALAAFGGELVEVRSLVVDTPHQRNGLGHQVLRGLLALAAERQVKTVFTLTTAVAFFEREGFVIASRHSFPLKIYRDCLKCPVKFSCDEVTMVYRPDGREA